MNLEPWTDNENTTLNTFLQENTMEQKEKDNILIVDDEPAVAESLGLLVSNFLGYDTLIAYSGMEAINKLKELKEAGKSVEAIIMDIKMKDMNGIETSKQIKIEVDRNIPIIFNTGFPDTFSKKDVLNEYPGFAYTTKGDDNPEELLLTIERAVRHYNLMNENADGNADDEEHFTVKFPQIRKSELPTYEVIKNLLSNHKGEPGLYLLHLQGKADYEEKMAVLGGVFKLTEKEVGAGIRIVDPGSYPKEGLSKVISNLPIDGSEEKILNMLKPGGQALFVIRNKDFNTAEYYNLANNLDKKGFIVERMINSSEGDLIIDARKPIIIQDNASNLILKEIASDKEMRQYYAITKEYFDLLNREIDMSFDEHSYHFLVYRTEDMLPLSTARLVPRTEIKLPVEFGKCEDGTYFDLGLPNSVEVSHLANISKQEIIKNKVKFSVFSSSLKLLFSAVAKKAILENLDNMILSFDERNNSLRHLYTKLGFEEVGKKISYDGFNEKYIVMKLNLKKAVEKALMNKNIIMLSLLNSILSDSPTEAFATVHDSMFDTVKSYQAMYKDIKNILLSVDKSAERKTVIEVPITTGNFSKMIANKYDIIGVDLFKYNLNIAENKIKEANPNANYQKVQADILRGLPFNDNSTERVVCTNLLYALKEPEKALKEIYRILTKGGYAVITNFNSNVLLPEYDFLENIENKYGKDAAEDIKFWKQSNDLLNISSEVYKDSYFDKSTFIEKLKEAGFTIEQIKDTFLGNAYIALVKKA